MPRSVESELAARLERGDEVMLATVVRVDREPPSRPGAKALVDRAGALAGTLGCSEFDSQALADAPAVLDAGSPAVRTYQHDLGSIEVYLEPYAPAPVLVVVGDTPVGRALAEGGERTGFRVVSVPEGGRLPDELGREVYLVHTNHDALDLPELLEAALRRQPPPRFVGLMGSRRHTGHHVDALRERGFAEADLARIQSPVGIDIGARTPEEIALSMLAGVVAVRRGADPRWLDPPR